MFDELRHNVKYSTIYSNSTFNRNVASDAQVPATIDCSAYQFGTHVKEKTMKVDENVFLRGDPAHIAASDAPLNTCPSAARSTQ